MTVRTETDAYLNAVERYAGRRFRHRWAIGALIDGAHTAGAQAEFERIVFLAKFVTGAFDILRRSGTAAEETRHLVRELNTNLAEISGNLSSLVDAGFAPEEALRFRERFLSLTQDSIEALRDLLLELTWVKQAMLDGRMPPIGA